MFLTKAIVLKYIKYSESSIIVRIYTELFGLKSYIVKGVRKKNAKFNLALFQPLMQLEMVVEHRERNNLHYIKEAKPYSYYQSLYENVKKSAITMFILELLNKTLKEESQNLQLFNFLSESFFILDKAQSGFNCFHYHFSMDLTQYLGFQPLDNYNETNTVFNLKEGKFQPEIDEIEYCVAEPLSSQLSKILSSPEYIVPQIYLSPLLDKIILYYQYHLPGIKDFRSPVILHKLLN